MADEGGRSRLVDAAAAFSSNARNPDLRRAQLSFLGAWTAEWAFTVALGIVAYRDGGATALGLVGLLRMVPSAICAPLLSPLADRGRRERVLIVVSAVRGVATAAAAVVAAVSGPPVAIYALAVLSTIAATLFRPAHSALLPSLCHTGHELASANVVRGFLDSAATLVGPLLAAVLLELTDVAVVFAVSAASSLWAVGLLLRLRYEAPPRPSAPHRRRLVAEAVDGLRAVVQSRDLALVLGLGAAQALTRGALTVLSVVLALELLGTGEPGVGTLMTAVGVGAVLGSLAASLLVGTRQLGTWFAVGVALWGLPIALVGVFPGQAVALGLLAFVGVGNALVDVAGFTLLGRMAPDEVLARVFGVLESLVAVFMGLGAVAASWLVATWGPRGALVGIGLVCPLLALASWWRLRVLDSAVGVHDADVALLQQVPMLRTLPLPTIEQLARGLEASTVSPGEEVVRQGDVGDRYYVIESGQVDVVGDGHVLDHLGPGEGFGEIALLRSTRRTATVVARTDLRLRSLRSDRFLPVVLGFTPSARVAASGVDLLLDRFAPRDPDAGAPTSSSPVTDDFDKGYWERHWEEREGGGATAAPPPNPHLLREVATLAPATALDAGCGEGAEAIWLASQGWQVTGADISALALARASEHAQTSGVADRVEWVEADLATWQPETPYDLVTTHYAHPAIPQLEFYERIAQWVAPGGTLLIVGHLHKEAANGQAAAPGPGQDDHGHGHGHGHGQNHGHDGQPPAEASATAATITALLDGAEWDVVTAEELTRTAGGAGGNGTPLHDVVVRATRRPLGS